MFDSLETLEKIGVNNKAARVWYKLNKDTRIQVKTAAGMTDTMTINDCIGQGTAGVGLISRASIDRGLQDQFNHDDNVMMYGNVRIQPLAYQDDIASINNSVSMTRIQSKKISFMLDTKLLEGHQEKTIFLVIGSKTFKEQVKVELEQEPLTFGSFTMIEKESDKYLGQIIHSDGLARSSLATVE